MIRWPAIASFVLFALTGAAAAEAASMHSKYTTGGYIHVPGTVDHTFDPHPRPRALAKADGEGMKRRGNGAAAAQAADYMKAHAHTLGLMLIDRGRIVYEGYRKPGGTGAEFYAMSISKSLAGMAVGAALCAGKIPSLDTPAMALVPELAKNNYGKSTVRQLLTMSSGAYVTIKGGEPDWKGRLPGGAAKTSGAMRRGQLTAADVLWGFVWDGLDEKNTHQPGAHFYYKGGDPMALSVVVERATAMPLAAWWGDTVWRQVRGKHSGHWEADRAGVTMAAAGAQFRLDDWGRIALWVLEKLKASDCMGGFMRAATTTQIKNEHLALSGKSFDGYGYQWWTENKQAPGFWGLGFAGQNMAINPKTGKVLIKFSNQSSGGSESALYRLFRNWNRAGDR